jgi:hypothetical protein
MDPYNALITLNRRSRSLAAVDVAAVESALFAAFLEDMRADYENHDRDTRCVILLDDVDNGGGQAFLKALIKARSHGLSDPLVVVCTASKTRAIPGVSLPGLEELLMCRPEDASYADWQKSITPTQPAARGVYCIRLRDLTAEEANDLEPTATQQLPDLPGVVHGLAGGHPAGARMLLDAAAVGVPAADVALLRGLFASPAVPAPFHLARPSLDEALDPLWRAFTADQRAALTVCAAARDFEGARKAQLLGAFEQDIQNTLASKVGTHLWLVAPSPQDAGTRGGRGSGYLAPSDPLPAQPVIHPWLRLLLLAQLAYPRNEAPERPQGLATWESVHRRLQTWNRAPSQILDRQYHTLALEEMDPVVEWLGRRLEDPAVSPDTWLYELYMVTSAPQKDPCLPQQSASERAYAIAKELAPVAYSSRHYLAVLVAALWLAADPRNRISRPEAGPSELNPIIQVALQQLAMNRTLPRPRLLDEAQKFR